MYPPVLDGGCRRRWFVGMQEFSVTLASAVERKRGRNSCSAGKLLTSDAVIGELVPRLPAVIALLCAGIVQAGETAPTHVTSVRPRTGRIQPCSRM
jgi:hypothetical protein